MSGTNAMSMWLQNDRDLVNDMSARYYEYAGNYYYFSES